MTVAVKDKCLHSKTLLMIGPCVALGQNRSALEHLAVICSKDATSAAETNVDDVPLLVFCFSLKVNESLSIQCTHMI